MHRRDWLTQSARYAHSQGRRPVSNPHTAPESLPGTVVIEAQLIPDEIMSHRNPLHKAREEFQPKG
jgi:hypothetical protein